MVGYDQIFPKNISGQYSKRFFDEFIQNLTRQVLMFFVQPKAKVGMQTFDIITPFFKIEDATETK